MQQQTAVDCPHIPTGAFTSTCSSRLCRPQTRMTAIDCPHVHPLTCWRPSLSGRSTDTRLSKRPGRRSAWSSTSGRLVAAMQMTTLSCKHRNRKQVQ